MREDSQVIQDRINRTTESTGNIVAAAIVYFSHAPVTKHWKVSARELRNTNVEVKALKTKQWCSSTIWLSYTIWACVVHTNS